MHLRRIASLAALAAMILALPATASANYRVGMSEQSPAMFDQPAWQALKLKRVRYIVPWDWYKNAGQNNEVVGFMNRAHAAGQDVLVAFSARRGCYESGKYSRSSACKAPSTSAYKSAVTRFHKAYPWVKTYSPWNEENHVSQPTHSSPKRAVQYYDTLRKACKGCTVMAADVLDQSNVTSWLKSFLHYSHGRGTIWGLHNYKDVNRRQSKGLTSVLKTVPGQLWLTETGGIVTFLPDFKTSTARASSATKYMFQLADRYDSKRSGYRSKLTRLYVYRWFGEAPGATFDAGLVNPDGTPRSALAQFQKYVKNRLK
ncbi:glycosyl hydrolase [Candidatus Solirubrobacter pratensis]|uniref:glycosyl hydrolase n=1 Tax=Candidatus Solirubrobacter pratensis TaxID=1298857 RepID=UPI00056A4974|nr:glycosyl hydrolase [Candidatus Solirubrobacter pratensis]